MRSKLNVTLVLALVGLFSVATACGDDGSGVGDGGDAGESAGGSGGAMSSGGSAAAGKAGNSSSNTGGDPSSSGGNPSTSGGEPGTGGDASNGGEASSGGDTSSGGEAPGSGGSGSGGDSTGTGGAGGEGAADPVTCTEITLGQFETLVEADFTRYSTTFTPNIGAVDGDVFRFSVFGPPEYDGDDTGTFDLTQNGDDNLATCSRCIVVVADLNGDFVNFFQSEGTLVIDDASTPLAGSITATVTNLKLVEVTVGGGSTTTPVPGGACLTVASANIVAEPPPCEGFQCQDGECLPRADWQCDEEPDCDDGSDELPLNPLCVVPDGWQCSEDYVGDSTCDCGCGAKDTDCASTTDTSECDYCLACSGPGACQVSAVDPQDTTACL